MTVSTTTNKDTFAGTGLNTVLPTTFPFIDEADLIVTRRVTATGVETVMVLTTDYTVTGGNYAIGDVTPVDGATDFPTSVTWTIERDTPRTQSTDYVENDSFAAGTHEQALDKLTHLVIDRQGQLDRSLKVPVSDSDPGELPNEIDRASKYLGFDASGDPVALDAPTDTAIVTSFMKTVLDDANAAAARSTLFALTNAMNARGDITFQGASGDAEKLAIGTANKLLRSDGTDPEWQAAVYAAGPASKSMLPLPRNHLAGLPITRTSTTEINIGKGECRCGTSSDPNIANFINVNAAFGKLFDGGGWDSGDGGGGVPTAVTFAASIDTWHFFALVSTTGAQDFGYDTSVTAVNLLADSDVQTALAGTAIYYRRLFSFVSSATPTILDFKHLPGGRFMQVVPILSYTATATDFSAGVSVLVDQIPDDLNVVGLLRVNVANGNSAQPVVFQALHETSSVPSLTLAPLGTVAPHGALLSSAELEIDIDPTQQIRVRVLTDTSMDVHIVVKGWIDSRGQDD